MPHATRPGDVLGDRYRLVDLLTESEGGRFWRAHDPVLGRHVAIHVIGGDDDRAPALMEAARRSATVPDRRVLRVLDAERTDDECYVVNEWGWGTSLDIVVAARGSIDPRLAAWLVGEVADSIAEAHAVGVAHGRLNPENVLIDRAGGIRIIGTCVDAALHGIDDRAGDPVQRDLDDLAGLLYCALTGRWAGSSGSIVAAAPHRHGDVLRPRQVRAGIPGPLDLLCDDVLHRLAQGRHREPVDGIATARGMADYLADFVGDPVGMPEALLDSTPDVLPEEEQVVLPPVPELLPHDDDEQRPPDRHDHDHEPHATPVGDDRPTQAGVPIFGDGDDDVSWLNRRTTPPPPPPPFEAHPERPLFAPEPAGGTPRRTPRETPVSTGSTGSTSGTGAGFWPWDTGTSAGPGGATSAPVDDEPVPGRTFLRLATVLAVLVLLGVAVVVAIKLSGDDEPGGPSTDGSDRGSAADLTSGEPAARRPGARSPVLTDVEVSAYDPQGDPPSENDAEAALAVDGDLETRWTTQGYDDQLGSVDALKSGVGLAIDLGGARRVSRVELALAGTPTSVSLYLLDQDPRDLDDVTRLDPAAQGTADGGRLTLDAGGTRAAHAVVWLTSLPLDDEGRFRGSVAEVVVRGG